MNTTFDARNPTLFEVPVPPETFGQDGGKFYHFYDALADEIDDNMVAGLKEQLDGLLIFAGLFAGVNTAFLALTLPLMSPDPAGDIKELLRDNNAILLNLALGKNDSLSLPNINVLPSQTFSPPSDILLVNVLFSVSLTFALISSFLAVLGRQWLVYYRKRTGGGPDRQRWEQLRRFLGASRWRLESVLDDFLPSLLQTGLIIFCISLTIYLNSLHPLLSQVVGALMGAGLAILMVTAILSIWDRFCPFQSPLSHLIPLIGEITVSLIIHLVSLISFAFLTLVWMAASLPIWGVYGKQYTPSLQLVFAATRYVGKLLNSNFIRLITFLVDYFKREEEEDGNLHITAVRRAICTSDDTRTQAQAVSNILGITNTDLLCQLATDYEFFFRILNLSEDSYNRTLQICGRDRADMAVATCWLYRAAITHIHLSTNLVFYERFTHEQRVNFSEMKPSDLQLSLPSGLIRNAPPNLVAAWLGYMADSGTTYPSQDRHLTLGFIIDGLVNPSWKSISMITAVVMVEWGVGDHSHRGLQAAYTGKPSITLQNLRLLVEESDDPYCKDRVTLWRYLIGIFKSARAAAADSRGDPSNGPNLTAIFLRVSERLIRVRDLPSDLRDVGRSLRGELISALCLECEKRPLRNAEYSEGFREMLEELHHLFTELTAYLALPFFASDAESSSGDTVNVLAHHSPHSTITSWRPTTFSDEGDDELVHLLSPILRNLDSLASRLDGPGVFRTPAQNAQLQGHIEKLNTVLASFKARAEIVSQAKRRNREFERRKRDPDLRWCYHHE